MSQIFAAVGIVKCPTSGQIYGVRMEERDNGILTATWAFPIKPEVAQHEGYEETEFPADIAYDPHYPGCPYCEKREDLAEISVKPKKEPVIMVGGKSSYDDLGSVLTSMGINWQPMGDLHECDILFLNCLGDKPSIEALRQFVNDGGCVFGSCTQRNLLESAFPGAIKFKDIGFESGTETATIEDADLRSFIGKSSIDINFHLAGSGNPNGGSFTPILKSTGKVFAKGTNICVKANYGKGMIFFTMFHNADNQNDHEKALLKLLVLKGIGNSQNQSLSQAGAALGIDMDRIKAQFRSNF
jgi:hypothetical protein